MREFTVPEPDVKPENPSKIWHKHLIYATGVRETVNGFGKSPGDGWIEQKSWIPVLAGGCGRPQAPVLGLSRFK